MIPFTDNIFRNKNTQLQAKPITSPFSHEGITIQLWECKGKLLGSVTKERSVFLISGCHIHNSMHPTQKEDDLLRSLLQSVQKTWDLIFYKGEIYIWPHLIASGDPFLPFTTEYSRLKHVFRPNEEGHLPVDTPENRQFIRSATTPEHHQGIDQWGNDVYIRTYTTPEGQSYQAWAVARNGIIENGGRNERPARFNPRYKVINRYPNRFNTFKQPNQRQTRSAQRRAPSPRTVRLKNRIHEVAMRRFGREGPGSGGSGGSGGNPPKGSGGKPGLKHFEQKLQQAKLTDSYNGTHKQNPVPARQGYGGTIGGVACSVSTIEGLFDTPESIFEGEHHFCLPCSDDKRPLFSDSQLKQILRELACGIYRHGAIPFFSLHFRKGGESLYPIIHPAYENTLVGRVISLLDYFMKGYLNGATFEESFIDSWHKNPSWEKRECSSQFSALIDLESYCNEHLNEDSANYQSVRDRQGLTYQKNFLKKLQEALKCVSDQSENSASFQDLMELQTQCKALETDNSPESKFDGFHNSFRIIAKQKGFQKEGTLFYIDSDFEVKYTVDPSHTYKEVLDTHLRKHKSLPPSYINMIKSYDEIADAIHKHMIKMPFCKEYFNMLGVIDFFANYFSTLKSHRKIPTLPPTVKTRKSVPPLFPHLPIPEYKMGRLEINLSTVFRLFFQKYTSSSRQQNTEELKQQLIDCFYQNIVQLSEPALIRFRLRTSPSAFQKEVGELIKEEVDLWFPIIDRVLSNPPNQLNKFLNEIPLGTIAVTQEFPYKALQLQREIKDEEREFNKRIVGGCGVSLSKMPLLTSEKMRMLLKEHSMKLISLTPESWIHLNLEGQYFGVFGLPFEDIPPSIEDDFSWMEELLQEDTDERRVEEWELFADAISRNDWSLYEEMLENTHFAINTLKGSDGASLLHLAALQKETRYVKDLLSRRCSPHEEDQSGFIPLHYAAMEGHIETLTALDEARPNLHNKKSLSGLTPLYLSIQYDRVEVFSYLLKKGALPSVALNGYTDLHCAIHERSEKIMAQLLSSTSHIHASLNVVSEEGGTPLIMAVEAEKKEWVEKLLALGANPNQERRDGVTPLELTVRLGLFELFELLFTHTKPMSKLTIEAICQTGTALMAKRAVERREFLEYTNLSRDTPLHIALRHGNAAVASILCDHLNEEQLTSSNVEKQVPLQLALKLELSEVASKLHSKGVEIPLSQLVTLPFQPFFEERFEKEQPHPEQIQDYLLKAIKAGQGSVVTNILLRRGGKVEDEVDNRGKGAIHYLAQFDQIFLFRKWACRSQDLLLPLKNGKTLPYIAAESRSPRVLSYLLAAMEKRALPLSNHYQKRHLLYPLLQWGDLSLIKQVITRDPESLKTPIDGEGRSAIHIAAQIGAKKIAKELDEAGVDWNHLDEKGRSALFYAIRGEHEKMVVFLLSKKSIIRPLDLYWGAKCQEASIMSLLRKEAKSATDALDKALILSAERGALSVFFQLREWGGSFAAKDRTGEPLLALASHLGRDEIVKALLIHSKQVNQPIAGERALERALEGGHFHCASLLLKRGVKAPTGKDKHAYTPSIRHLLEKGPFTYHPEVEAFFQALKENDEAEVMRFLIKTLTVEEYKKELVSAGEGVWGSPLHIAFRLGSTPLTKSIALHLEKMQERFKAPLSILEERRDSQGNTLSHLLVKKGISPLFLPAPTLKRLNHQTLAPIHLAAELGDAELLKQLIAWDPSCIEQRDGRGQTALFYTLSPEKEDNLTVLLEGGATPNIWNHTLQTPLLHALKAYRFSCAKQLLDAGAQIDAPLSSPQISLLQLMARYGDEKQVRFLILEGARIDLLYKNKYPLIHLAAEGNKQELLQLLHGKGVSLKQENRKKSTLIHGAARLGKTDLLKKLAQLEEENLIDFFSLEIEGEGKEAGASPLHMAARSGNRETVSYLLDNYARPDQKTRSGEDVQSYAALAMGGQAVVDQLNTYKFANERDSISNSLLYALSIDNVEVVKQLFKNGWHSNSTLEHNETPLHWAVRVGALNSAAYLLQQGANPLLKNKEGESSFEIAAAQEGYEGLQLLLDHTPINLNTTFNMLRSLLHIAVINGKLANASLLITRGAPLNAVDARLFTPLHYASEKNDLSMVSLLLGCGAEMDVKGIGGEKAIDLGNQMVKQLIQNRKSLIQRSPASDTPLHLAIREENLSSIRCLAALYPLGEKTNLESTSIQLAEAIGNQNIVHYLKRMAQHLQL